MISDESDRKRTLSQNAKMWPMLTDFSRQLDWRHTRGGVWVLDKMSPPTWKNVLTAAFEGELEVAEGVDGALVMIGASTSNYGVRKFADFIEFLYAIGNERGVQWSEKSLEHYELYGRKNGSAQSTHNTGGSGSSSGNTTGGENTNTTHSNRQTGLPISSAAPVVEWRQTKN